MQMPGRNASTGDYRYGFNGMENDDEWTGSKSHYDFGARCLDVRLGRFLSVDNHAGAYPSWSPYTFAYSNPTNYVDPDGNDPRWGQLATLAQIHQAMLHHIRSEGLEDANYGWGLNSLRDYFGGNRYYGRVRDGAYKGKLYDKAVSVVRPRYLYTSKYEWVDMRHIFGVLMVYKASEMLGEIVTYDLEHYQSGNGQYAYEDIKSNMAASDFYHEYNDQIMDGEISFVDAFMEFFSDIALDPSDAPNYDKIPHQGTAETNVKWWYTDVVAKDGQAVGPNGDNGKAVTTVQKFNQEYEKWSDETKEKVRSAHKQIKNDYPTDTGTRGTKTSTSW
jgi:RHS repeat-associated protein